IGALKGLGNLRHISLLGYWFQADMLEGIVPPEAESVYADLLNLGPTARWPALRSFRHSENNHSPPLEAEDVKTLAAYPLIEQINVRCRGLKAAHIKALSEAPRLRELTLRFDEDSKVPSLKALSKAPALESLQIVGQITDQHLLDIANIHGLRFLS